MTGIWVGPHFRWRNVNHLQKRGETRKCWASQVEPVVKNSPASVGRIRDVGLITGLGRSPGGENGNPLQYSCLENSMDKGAWRATIHGVTKSQTRLKQLSTHTQEMPLSPTWTEFRKKRYNFTIKALLFIFKNRPVHSHVCVVSWRAYHPASPDHRVFPSNSASINTDYHQQEATF